MSKFGSWAKYWLPLLLWMGVIFAASADNHSGQHSNELVLPVLRWLFPHISARTAGWVVFGARKCAHLTEYAVFALLVWRALCKPAKGARPSWDWRRAGVTLLVVFFYACSDEFHQRFVPTRDPTIHDVVIDTLGGGMALLALWFFRFHRRRVEE